MVNRRLTRQTATVAMAMSAVLSMPVCVLASAGQVPLPTARSVAGAVPSPSPTPTPIPPGKVRVEVVLLRSGERLTGEDSVAWMEDMQATGPTSDPVKIAQREKQFEPRISIVSVGSTVDFPNFDRVFHNVFSLSTAQSFDLGLYRKGKSKAVHFKDPGLVQVYCNIHPHMAAYLMIVDSARHGVADGDGLITLDSIPAGEQTVKGWNVRGGMWTRRVTVRPGRTATVTVELDVSSWRDMPHLNKHGKEYPPPDDDEFRY
jgi:plastocyanin